MRDVNILEHVYTCSDDAAKKIESYLYEIHEAFKNEPEIIRDIELAIIEQLDLMISERIMKQLTLIDIEFLIQKMGDAKTLDDDSTQEKPSVNKQNLYRDHEHRIIAGVCSGIAAYFTISSWVIRFIFILCIFTPIPVVIIYLLMWYLLPSAVTKPDKLNMQGIPVTIDTIVNTNQYVRNQITHLAKFIAIGLATIAFSLITAVVFVGWCL